MSASSKDTGSGSFSGTSGYDPNQFSGSVWGADPNQDYGQNVDLNQTLSRTFGYGGDFGGGQWNQWSQNNLNPDQQQYASKLINKEEAGRWDYDPTGYGQYYGSNPDMNQQLATQFGYGGDFGQGGWDRYMAGMSPEQQAQAQQMMAGGGAGVPPAPAPGSPPVPGAPGPVAPGSVPGAGTAPGGATVPGGTDPSFNLINQTFGGLGDAMGSTQNWMGYRPDTLAGKDLQPYMNPYQQSVIDASMGEMQRQHDIQGNYLDAGAVGAGAFGGDRHGIAQSEMNRNFADQQQRWLADFNAKNFGQAQGAAQYDIGNQYQNQMLGLGGANQLANMANMGFGWGQDMQQQQRQSGMDQFAMQQAVLDNAYSQFQQSQQWPYQQLGALTAGLPGVGGSQTTQQSSSPGLMDFLGLGLQLL